MTYVIDIHGKPLMPSRRDGKVCRLLKNKRAHVVDLCPFTIQLDYETTTHVQEVSLGVDSGSKTIGLSATTETRELYAAEVQLRNDIVDLLSTRREARRTRRGRIRHRKARFNNRVSTKKQGWLAPSIRQKIQTHETAIARVHRILPISRIVVETASFDTQRIKNPDVQGTDYQHGDQLGFWNVREYVLWRDGHKCQCCHGKSKDKVLNVHHIESRKTGGNSPDNLITLCETCHNAYHNGERPNFKPKRGKSLRDAAFMGIMRWALYESLKATYPDVNMTFGYITKHTRIANGLPKEHRVDARCISGNPMAEESECWYLMQKVRCHNRKIHKANMLKGGIRKLNQAPKEVHGYRLFDMVMYQGRIYHVFGRRTTGYFDIRDVEGNKVKKGAVSHKQLTLLKHSGAYIINKQSNKKNNE